MNTKEKQWANLAAEVDRRGGDGVEVVKAYQELYSIHSDKICSWLGGLYDHEIGGFYYSNSARDNEYVELDGVKHYFLPDIESTHQATNFLKSSGMLDSYDELPPEMTKKLIDFTCSLQSPEDGYIYHPQWGKNIKLSRRGRDMMWAVEMEEKFGFKLPYPTAIERLSTAEKYSVKKEELLAVMPEHLRSREAFLSYLNSLDWDNKAYAAGNFVAAQVMQIEAAGLMPTAIGFINSMQNPQTGTWGNKTGYDAVNAILKISSIYQNHPIPNPMKVAMNAMDCITLPTRVETVCWQYNAWFSVRNVIQNLRKFGDNKQADEIVAEMLRRAPAGIRASADKVKTFICDDGSYSYTPEFSSSTSQAKRVSLGLKEGDVNATVINCTGVIYNSLKALELIDYKVKPFDKQGLQKFLSAIRI